MIEEKNKDNYWKRVKGIQMALCECLIHSFRNNKMFSN